MIDFNFRDDGVYYAHVKTAPGSLSKTTDTVFVCFVYSDGCIAVQWETVLSNIELNTDLMHDLFLWHHDVKKSNVSSQHLAILKEDESELITADIHAPKAISLRLVPINKTTLTMLVTEPWKSAGLANVGFAEYDSYLQ